MVGPPTACPDCGWVMPSNALPKHQRARHGDPRLSLMPSLDEQQQMVTRYVQGATQAAIARELMWSPSTVSRVLIVWGENRPGRRAYGHPPKLSADEVLKTAQLYGMGYSQREVADMLGLHPSAVGRRLDAAGVQRRPPGWASAAQTRMRRKRSPARGAA